MRPFANLLCTLVNCYCYYFTAGRVRSITISVSVCLFDRVSQKRRVETYPDLPVAVHGSALFSWCFDTICTSGFVDDVSFAHDQE